MIKKREFLGAALIAIAISNYANGNTLSASATNQGNLQSAKILQLKIIQDQIFLDSQDIANISITGNEDNKALKIELTADGTKKLQQFSTQHLQQILQISSEDIVLSQATIMTPLPGTFIVSGMDEETMQKIVRNFQHLSKSERSKKSTDNP